MDKRSLMIRRHVETFFSPGKKVFFMPLNDENQNILYIPSELKVWSLENETYVLFYRKNTSYIQTRDIFATLAKFTSSFFRGEFFLLILLSTTYSVVFEGRSCRYDSTVINNNSCL